MLHLTFNIIEISLGLFFFIYLTFKGVKQKNHPKIVLGISFTIGVFSTLFHLIREDFAGGLLPSVLLSSAYYPFGTMSIWGFFFVFLMLIKPDNQEQLFLLFL